MIPISRLAGLILSHRLEIEAAGQTTARIDEFYRKFQEFQGYVYRNIGSLADYATHWRQGERASTAHVESTVNQLVNQRMCKSGRCAGHGWAPNSCSMCEPRRSTAGWNDTRLYVDRRPCNDLPIKVASELLPDTPNFFPVSI